MCVHVYVCVCVLVCVYVCLYLYVTRCASWMYVSCVCDGCVCVSCRQLSLRLFSIQDAECAFLVSVVCFPVACELGTAMSAAWVSKCVCVCASHILWVSKCVLGTVTAATATVLPFS